MFDDSDTGFDTGYDTGYDAGSDAGCDTSYDTGGDFDGAGIGFGRDDTGLSHRHRFASRIRTGSSPFTGISSGRETMRNTGICQQVCRCDTVTRTGFDTCCNAGCLKSALESRLSTGVC